MGERLSCRLAILKLHLDIEFTNLLIYVVTTAGEGGGSFRPEVWFYLGDRYQQLAERYEQSGRAGQAEALRDKAQIFLRAGPQGDGDPPPTAALAMPIPKIPVFTEAIGFRLRSRRETT